MTISKPYSFVGGTLAVSAQVNSNFDTLYNYLNIALLRGSGSPEGVVTANIGALYEDSNSGGTGVVYRKTTDGGNTGWVTFGVSSGGSLTITNENIDSMYEEFYISDSGDKIFNITNYIGENFVKNVWSNSGNLNTARQALGGTGTQNSGLSFGGTSAFENYFNTTEKFNGYNWTNTGNLNTARYGLYGVGTQNAGLSFGGYNGSALNVTEKYNGSTWSTTGNLNTARQALAGAGTQNSALSFGGTTNTTTPLANTEKFNGAIWSTTGNLNTARQHLVGCGIHDNCISMGGTISGSNSYNIVEKFTGLVWVTQSSWNLNNGVWASGSSGTQNSALIFGGIISSYTTNTEKFNGSTWFITSSLNTAMRNPSGAGTQNSGLSFGGYNGSALNVTEKFTGEPKFNYYTIFKNATNQKEFITQKNKQIKFEAPCYIAIEVRPLSEGLTEE
ncbi:MAG: hypothetical protein WDK95_14290, partial [Syntrophorhabdaceae bacterium]